MMMMMMTTMMMVVVVVVVVLVVVMVVTMVMTEVMMARVSILCLVASAIFIMLLLSCDRDITSWSDGAQECAWDLTFSYD